ncbi:hypothetical protein KIW84_061985 [Lathyrus oleraceus]|uniref:Uncharacterized protein n=1 Tax=Pisum sativum TaxID=3888 RepID=A0A9D4W7F0_PEA|nr:hypothetical protein KIW84_061985 [Pisum sativum]
MVAVVAAIPLPTFLFSSSHTFNFRIHKAKANATLITVSDWRIQKSRCSRRLYEGRVSQGPLTQTPVLFKFYLGTRAGGVVADMMAANELNSHRFLQVRYFNHSILLILHCGFKTTIGEQWLSFCDYGKSSAADYAKVASDKVSKLSSWNSFE